MPNEHLKEEHIGSINISDQILCACVANSVGKFPGIINLSEEGAEKALDILSRDLAVSDGVRLARKGDNPTVDVFVVVEYGTQIPKLAWELQKKVQEDVLSITGQKITDINIHIEGVSSKG